MEQKDVNTTAPEAVQPVAQPEPVVQPTAEPVQPAAPEAPVQPVAPEAPVQPVAPEAPVQPAAPASTPVGMTPAPAQPAAPVAPGTTPNGFAAILAKFQALGMGPIIAIAVVAVVLVGGIVFSAVSSTPKAVFKGAINKVYKISNTAIDSYETYLKEYDLTENAVNVNADFSVKSNMEDFEDSGLNKMSLAFDAGVDYKNELLSFGADLKGSKEKISLDAQYASDEMYIKSSLFEEVLKIDSEMLSDLGLEVDFETLKEEIKTYEKEYNTDPETYEYLAKTIKDALIKSLNSEYMEKEKEEIEVLDKEIKVTKNSLIFDEDAVQEMVEVIAEYLLEEEDFAKTLADAAGLKKSEVKELLKELKKSAKDIEFDGEVALNIYTKGLLNSIVGMGVEVEGKEYISMYTDGKNAEITFDDHDDSEYGTKVVIAIEQDGKGYKVEVKENKEKLLTMNIKEATEETIDCDITAYEEGEKVATIGVYLSVKQNKETFNGEYKFKVENTENDEYVEFNGKYTITIKDKLEKMSGTKDAVSIEELDTEKVTEEIENIAEKDEELGALIESTLSSLEEDMLDLNSIGMLEVESEKAESLLTNTKGTALFIGSTYYSYYSESDAYDFLYNIQDLQNELDFYSYYLDEYYVTTSLEEALGKVTTNCVTVEPVVEKEETPTEEEKTPTEEEKTPVEEEKTPVEEEKTPVEEEKTEGEEKENSENEEKGETITNCIPNTTDPEYPALYLIKDGKVQKVLTPKSSADEIKAALAEIGIK